MENAVDALKIAFGVLVFVIAITVSFMLFSQAKSTSDIVMYSSDQTNYYRYENEKKESFVTIDTIISAIYRYSQESIIVQVYDKNDNLLEEFNKTMDAENGLLLVDIKNKIQDFIKNILIPMGYSEFKEEFLKEATLTNNKIIIKYTEQ